MKIGNLVTFNHLPTKNTPGVPSSEYPGVGTIVGQPIDQGILFKGDLWADIMWHNNEVTRCFKSDLSVIEDIDNFDVNHF